MCRLSLPLEKIKEYAKNVDELLTLLLVAALPHRPHLAPLCPGALTARRPLTARPRGGTTRPIALPVSLRNNYTHPYCPYKK